MKLNRRRTSSIQVQYCLQVVILTHVLPQRFNDLGTARQPRLTKPRPLSAGARPNSYQGIDMNTAVPAMADLITSFPPLPSF